MKAEYVSHYLSDRDIANFARLSFDKRAEDYTEEQNNSLIRFLARGMSTPDWDREIQNLSLTHDPKEVEEMVKLLKKTPIHWVPFGHPQITLRMQAPIPIRVQCFKHKIGFVESEESRRYISSTPQIHLPEYFRQKASSAKQGSAGKHPDSDKWIQEYKNTCYVAADTYTAMIADGVCPEQARFVLPQGAQVNWVWTGSLYAYANYCNQRLDTHAQKESQDLARIVHGIIRPLYPVAWEALTGS